MAFKGTAFKGTPAAEAADANKRMLRWAWTVGAVVLVAGLVVIVGPALRHADALFDNPFVGQVEQRTVDTFDANGVRTGRQVTTQPAGSWLERSLGPGGVLLLRVAVVAIAAFMAGALVYRTASGNFPSEVAGVVFAEKATGGLEELTRTVATVVSKVEGLRLDVDAVSAAGANGVAAVAKLNDRVDAVAEHADALNAVLARLTSGLTDTADGLEALRLEVAGERIARRRPPRTQ